MSLTLHYHPLSSYCHKVLIALYEKETPFARNAVNLSDESSRRAFEALWPMGSMPVLRDQARGQTIAESSIIIEYLDLHAGGPSLLPPAEPARLEARFWDRFYDIYLHTPMQKIVGDRLRPEGDRDPAGVTEARDTMRHAYSVIESRLGDRAWAAGEAFTLADCAASPPLFYACAIEPFTSRPRTSAYFERLMARPSIRKVIQEARPFFQFFPFVESMPARFRGDA